VKVLSFPVLPDIRKRLLFLKVLSLLPLLLLKYEVEYGTLLE